VSHVGPLADGVEDPSGGPAAPRGAGFDDRSKPAPPSTRLARGGLPDDDKRALVERAEAGEHGLGVGGDLTSFANAQTAITALDAGIQTLSTTREGFTTISDWRDLES